MLTQEPAPDPKYNFNISPFRTLPHYHIVSFLAGSLCALYWYYKRSREGIGSGCLLYITVWQRDRGCELACIFFFYFTCVFVFCSLCPAYLCFK